MTDFSYLENKFLFSQLKKENLLDQTVHLIKTFKKSRNEKARSHSLSKNVTNCHSHHSDKIFPFLNLTQENKISTLYKNKETKEKKTRDRKDTNQNELASRFKNNVEQILKNKNYRSNDKLYMLNDKKNMDFDFQKFDFFDKSLQSRNKSRNFLSKNLYDHTKISKSVIEILDLILRKANIRLLNSQIYEQNGELEKRKFELLAKILCVDEDLGKIIKKLEDFIDSTLKTNDENKNINSLNSKEIEQISLLAMR
jgi:hypothetical protein